MRLASRDEALVPKRIYAKGEFQKVFVEWLKKEESKKARARH
jgi:hypothetical protein